MTIGKKICKEAFKARKKKMKKYECYKVKRKRCFGNKNTKKQKDEIRRQNKNKIKNRQNKGTK